MMKNKSNWIRKGMPLLMLGFLLMSVVLASAANQTTLSVTYYYTNEAQKSVAQKLLDQYEASHPNIRLNVQVTTQSKYITTLQTRAVAGDAPDVAMMSAQWIGSWITEGLLQEGNKYISKSELQKFDAIRNLSSQYKGKIYGLAVASTVRSMAYNADYFKKAGITPPTKLSEAWTWDQMIDAAKKAQAASGAKYAFEFEKASFDSWLPFLYQAGGQLLSNDNKKAAINSKEARRALEWTLKLHKDGTAMPGIIDGTEDPLRAFASGLTVMWESTNSSVETLEKQMKFNWGFTFMPRDKQQATVVGGTDWVAFKGKHPKEAWDLVLYLASPAAMATYNIGHTSIPSRSDVNVTWQVRPELESFFMEQCKAMPKKLQLDQITSVYAASRAQLMQELSTYVSGQQSVDVTLTNMEKILNSNIGK
jgi:multiple sugar transport system substrate-binding protein